MLFTIVAHIVLTVYDSQKDGGLYVFSNVTIIAPVCGAQAAVNIDIHYGLCATKAMANNFFLCPFPVD